MFFVKKKKASVWKIIAIAAGVAAIVAAGVAVYTMWKEKIYAQKKIEQEIEAIIEQKFAEQAIEELDENLAEA
ncbi:MAG: hypothetical protein IKA62_06710 [Clostridia bacterium]|nr:hypothetical protein [Clostridia bacterium]